MTDKKITDIMDKAQAKRGQGVQRQFPRLAKLLGKDKVNNWLGAWSDDERDEDEGDDRILDDDEEEVEEMEISIESSELLERSLSRIYQHHSQRAFVILTSWRGKKALESELGRQLSDEEWRALNLAQLKALMKQIRSAGYGFIPLDGVGQEVQSGKLVSAVEPSLLVPARRKGPDDGKLFKATLRWARAPGGDRAFAQDYIFYATPDQDGGETKAAVIKVSSGAEDFKLTQFSPNTMGQFYSRLRGGRTFKYEGIEPTDKSWMMVALDVDPGWWSSATADIEGAVDDPHITVIYMPDVTTSEANIIERWVSEIASEFDGIDIRVTGGDKFNVEDKGNTPFIARVEVSSGLESFRQRLIDRVENLRPGIVDRTFPEYQPHVTLYYGDSSRPAPMIPTGEWNAKAFVSWKTHREAHFELELVGVKYGDPPANWIAGMALESVGQDSSRCETLEMWVDAMVNHDG